MEFYTAGAAVLVSIVVAWTNARRSGFERVTALISDVSSGEVAHARHVLGTLAIAKGSLVERLDAALPDVNEAQRKNEAIRLLFILLWSFNLVAAQANSFGCWVYTKPEKLLKDSLGPWVDWWRGQGLAELATSLGADAETELKRLDELATRWRLPPKEGPRSASA